MTDGPNLQVLDELETQLTGALYPDHAPRRVARRRWLAPAGGVVAATAAVVVVVVLSSGSVRTPIASALDRAARAVEQRPGAAAVGPDQFWYTRSSAVHRFPLPIPPWRGSKPPTGAPPMVWLLQRSTTETWVGVDGTTRTRTVPGGPTRFATPDDRARYLATGQSLPRFDDGGDATVQGDDRFPPALELFRYRELLALPTEPHALYQRIHGALAIAQERTERELANTKAEIERRQQPHSNSGFAVLKVWSAGSSRGAAELSAVKGLLESPVPAAVRAALYRAAALIPGVHYDGQVHDALGRAGVGVSAGKPGSEFELIFDPATGALLGQHSPVVGDSATLAAGVAGAITALPSGVPPLAGPRDIAPVALRVQPSVGGRASHFAVRVRQPVSHGLYTFLVTGPTGPACRTTLLPTGLPPRPVVGSRAGRELTHRLRPPSATTADARWCAGSYRVQVAVAAGHSSRDLGTIRFRVR
jgi:hypothetical protein